MSVKIITSPSVARLFTTYRGIKNQRSMIPLISTYGVTTKVLKRRQVYNDYVSLVNTLRLKRIMLGIKPYIDFQTRQLGCLLRFVHYRKSFLGFVRYDLDWEVEALPDPRTGVIDITSYIDQYVGDTKSRVRITIDNSNKTWGGELIIRFESKAAGNAENMFFKAFSKLSMNHFFYRLPEFQSRYYANRAQSSHSPRHVNTEVLFIDGPDSYKTKKALCSHDTSPLCDIRNRIYGSEPRVMSYDDFVYESRDLHGFTPIGERAADCNERKDIE